MRIAEIYKSIQGEGVLTGTPSVFVRTSGCNLRCWFCDTPHASWRPEGRDYAIDEIVAAVEEWDCGHVVITGGEPMLFAELVPLCDALHKRRRHITIETAGTLHLELACDLMSISPKSASSAPAAARHPRWRRRHLRQRHRPEVIARLVAEYPYQVKFVIDRPDDVREVRDYLAEFPQIDPARVLLMPQGRTADEVDAREASVRTACDEHGWLYCPRMQLVWFGPVRRT